MSACVNTAGYSSGLSSKVALFNAVANKHIQSQAINPFSNDHKVGGLPRPKISKEEYGRPAKGSLSEARGFKANRQVGKEMLELCEIINNQGEPLFSPREKANDPRVVISFGELFSTYTVISNKLVGILLRARKHHLLDFEGECLFQRRDDHVPVILLKPIEEIREMFRDKTDDPVEPQKSSDEGSNSDDDLKPAEEFREILPEKTDEPVETQNSGDEGSNSDDNLKPNEEIREILPDKTDEPVETQKSGHEESNSDDDLKQTEEILEILSDKTDEPVETQKSSDGGDDSH